MPNTDFDAHFLTPGSLAQYRQAMATAVDSLVRHYGGLTQCHSGKSPQMLAQAMSRLEVCPEQGQDLTSLLERVGRDVLAHSLVVANPNCMAHLHCPPLIPALAAEVMISATNQSMDSWDQAPAATYLEQHVVDWLCRLFGLAEGDGIFTSGGTQSNFMGLLLARDSYAQQQLNWNIQCRGLPPQASRFRVLCSDISHFSVKQSAALLGLGHDAVVPVATDGQQCLCPQALAEAIDAMHARELLPIAVVGTAGTTDFGSIDPLEVIAATAKRHGLWFHVDAAYGGALALSDRHAVKLAGIGQADSITIDFHKLFYQPISCGAFLVRDRNAFNLIRLNADYLNPEGNEQAGILDLVGKSIQTTRRFDGLKLFITLNALGRVGLAAMIDATIELAARVGDDIARRPALELANTPSLNAVVFRRREAALSDAQNDALNARLREQMMGDGFAWLAQTRFKGRLFLKMTLLNPRTTADDITAILNYVTTVAAQ